MENLLIIFAKNPKSEKVKTRLAKVIGDEKATESYKKILDGLLENHTNNANYDLKVYYTGKKDYFLDFTNHLVEQKGADLGKKMYNAFCEELKKYEKVIIIGSDIPEINEKNITDAFENLEYH